MAHTDVQFDKLSPPTGIFTYLPDETVLKELRSGDFMTKNSE
jgi:hypothetical protein